MNTNSLLNLKNDIADVSGEWKVFNPARLEQSIGMCKYRYSDIELAIKGAGLVNPDGPDPRQVVAKARDALIQHQEQILKIARLELARTHADFAIEWEHTIAYLNALTVDEALGSRDLESRGLSVLLGSYVWPIFYSVQFALMNFVAGNPIILKPSEKSTLTVHAVIEVLRMLPELSSIQLLMGEREVGRRLATHEAVSTVLFQGSFEVGMRVKQDALSQPNKEVLLFLGSKNPAIVFADAKDGVEDAILKDAFLGAGQHCRSTSVIFVERARLRSFYEKFHELSKSFKIGGPESGAFMGPLIDGSVVDRFLKFVGISEREGAAVLMRGKSFVTSEKGHFVTPSIALFETLTPDRLRKSVSLQTEILSPHVSIIGFDHEADLTELLAQMNHGRLASIWTENVSRALRIARSLIVGEVLINQSVFEFDPWSTSQARKRSGNHARFGQGLLSQLTCEKVIRTHTL